MLPRLLALSAVLTAGISSAQAIEISTIRHNASMVFVVSGEIEAGDADKFATVWEKETYDAFRFTVALDSPVGSLVEGMKLDEFFRKQGVATVVQKYSPKPPMQSDWDYSSSAEAPPGGECYSACALAFMGGVEREVPKTSKIGFHQFSIGDDSGRSNAEVQVSTQSISSLVSIYLRKMEADPRLFELLSITPPDKMFIPKSGELGELGIVPSPDFKDFELKPRNGEIVASAVNPRNTRGLERVYEVEIFCWDQKPMINLYAKEQVGGLTKDWIAQAEGTWSLSLSSGDFTFQMDSLRLYPNQRILATLILDKKFGREITKGSFGFNVSSTTASGLLMGANVYAPQGDEAIAASLKGCL
ncbi:COG3904 family protein [Brucella oryzae]|uniref:COG3904 family protein n=1 Tax=Brucella oryzae TaxID=335286 RepID=UPI0035BC8D01